MKRKEEEKKICITSTAISVGKSRGKKLAYVTNYLFWNHSYTHILRKIDLILLGAQSNIRESCERGGAGTVLELEGVAGTGAGTEIHRQG